MTSIIKKVLRQVKSAIHQCTKPNVAPISHQDYERQRLGSLPRYVETTTDLPGFTIRIPDGPSFLAVWTEIFDRGIYEFNTKNPSPRILDCGANVGLGCVFFKTRFPKARVTAFEPDPKIFSYLQESISAAKLTDIELIPKAVWSATTILQFSSEGSDAGRIEEISSAKRIEIQAVRLRDYLSEPVDFLKMDIEGAETEVLLDSASLLANVSNIFVEYHSFSNKPQTLDQLLSTLKQAGFRVQIQPMLVAAKPFIKVENYLNMDLQLNIFAYRDRISSPTEK